MTKEERKIYNREYRKKNPEKDKAKCKKWRDENPEKFKSSVEKYRDSHPELNKVSSKKWRDANPEKVKAGNKKYRDANPEKVKANNKLKLAVRAGKIIKPTECQLCLSKINIEGHHWSYAPEHRLSVYWLCKNCHAKVHSEKIELRPLIGNDQLQLNLK